VGSRFEGRVAFCADYELVEKPGFYGHNPDGSINAALRLMWVDDAPHDPSDGKGHYEVAGPKDPVQKQAPTVSLEAGAEGSADVAGG